MIPSKLERSLPGSVRTVVENGNSSYGQTAWGNSDLRKEGFKIQLSSVAQPCLTLCDPRTAARRASLSTANSRSLLKFMSITVMLSNHLILCQPFSSCLQSFPALGSVSQFFASGGISIGVSTSVLPTKIYLRSQETRSPIKATYLNPPGQPISCSSLLYTWPL